MIELNETNSVTSDVAADAFVDDAARASFFKTISQMKKTVNSVRNLAQHAEDFFWQARAESFNSANLSSMSPNTDFDTTGVVLSIIGSTKICMAAYPMLNEILEKFSLICSLEHVPLGTGIGQTPWLDGDKIHADATGTFFIDTVIGICDEIDGMLERIREWNRNADGFDSISSIQKHYISALIQMRNRVNRLLNNIGPFWPPTICPFSPYVGVTKSVTGSGNTVYPTHFSATYDDTQTLRITLYHNAEIIPFSEAFRIAACELVHNGELINGAYDASDWGAAYTVMSNGDKVYRAEGGLVLVEVGADVNVDSGIYEVLEIGDELLLRNKLLRSHSSVAKKSSGLNDVTFLFRFLRKRREFYVGAGSPYEMVSNVQYKADASLFHGNNFAMNQRMNFVFTNAVNEHKAPVISPVINEDSEEEDFVSYSWVGVTNDGTVPPVVPGSYINNLSKDTLFNLVKSENSSMKGRITDAISLGTHILFCGEFTGLSGDQASLMLLNLATNRFEPFPIQGVEHGSAKSLSGYDNYIFGMFFVNNTWTNIIQFDRSDYSVVWTAPYRFIDVQDKDVIGDYHSCNPFHYFTIPGVGHFGTNREILDSMAVSSNWHVMLNKHSLISRHNVICPVAHEILGNSLHEIYTYDDSNNYCKILDALGNFLGTLNKPGKPKVLRNHEEARLLYGNEVWHVIVNNVPTKVASVDGADEINASVSATVGGVSSEIVFGKNITVSSETGIGYVYGLNRFIGTGLD